MPKTNLVVIKPSGVKFPDLALSNMVVVDIEGNMVEGDYKASSDTASHCYIYRHMPEVNGIVHTHSRYATAFATHNRPIPCITTAMGDEFGGDIPCGGFAGGSRGRDGYVSTEGAGGERGEARRTVRETGCADGTGAGVHLGGDGRADGTRFV